MAYSALSSAESGPGETGVVVGGMASREALVSTATSAVEPGFAVLVAAS